MATRVFSEEELAQLRGFPEITRDELIRFFTLTAADRAFVDPGRGRLPRDRLGLGVQLCTLAWLGFVADALGYHPVTTAKLAVQARRHLEPVRRRRPPTVTIELDSAENPLQLNRRAHQYRPRVGAAGFRSVP